LQANTRQLRDKLEEAEWARSRQAAQLSDLLAQREREQQDSANAVQRARAACDHAVVEAATSR